VYGSGHTGQIPEDAESHPFSPYGYHKRVMEDLCRSYAASYGQRAVIARLFSVYGSGLKKQLLWDLCSRLASGVDPLVLSGSGDELRDWTDVRDVVSALQTLLELADASVPAFNVGTGRGSTVREIATLVRDCWFEPGRPAVSLQFSGESRAGDPFSMIAPPDRLHSVKFRWHVELQEGLANYLAWFRRQSGAENAVAFSHRWQPLDGQAQLFTELFHVAEGLNVDVDPVLFGPDIPAEDLARSQLLSGDMVRADAGQTTASQITHCAGSRETHRGDDGSKDRRRIRGG
jgi:dTDP-D-glucose 4,6-dehydratase